MITYQMTAMYSDGIDDGRETLSGTMYVEHACGCKIVGTGTPRNPLDIQYCPRHRDAPPLPKTITLTIKHKDSTGEYVVVWDGDGHRNEARCAYADDRYDAHRVMSAESLRLETLGYTTTEETATKIILTRSPTT